MKALKDYGFLRGVNYPDWRLGDEEKWERDLGYAVKINLNQIRVQLDMEDYEADPKKYIRRLISLLKVADKKGISVIPILFNGNYMLFAWLADEYYQRADRYIKAVVTGLKNVRGLLMWDIMNEPSNNEYVTLAAENEKSIHWEEICNFLKYYCNLVRSLDDENAITIGHTYLPDVKDTIDEVDVFSFHNYLSTTKWISGELIEAKRYALEIGKPFFITEMGCSARANPYGLSIRLCTEQNVGWFLFELMIEGDWSEIQGIFYEDGSIRNPEIVTSILGIFRNRSESAIQYNPNREGFANQAIEMVREALTDSTEVFNANRKPIEYVLEAAEFCANFLEANELVPMYDPPTAQIIRIRKAKDAKAARKLAFDLAEEIRKSCLIIPPLS